MKVLAEAKELYKKLPEEIKICDGNGKGKPLFHTTEICFNGDGSLDLDHETFSVTPNPIDFEFCKTARKPYDIMACAVLISMKKHMVNFSYSSDGDKEDWAPAKKFYKSVFKTVKKIIPPAGVGVEMSDEKQKLVDAVIEQTARDFREGDSTVLNEILSHVPFEILLHSLPEEDWVKYKNE